MVLWLSQNVNNDHKLLCRMRIPYCGFDAYIMQRM